MTDDHMDIFIYAAEKALEKSRIKSCTCGCACAENCDCGCEDCDC